MSTRSTPSDSDATIASTSGGRVLHGEVDLERGDVIGRYVILERIGAGGMGVVFAAYDPELDRRVALKLVHGHAGASDGSRGQERLLREAQAMAKLSHPNVVAVHDAGTVRGGVFLAMEFVDGITLKKWMQGGHDWGDTLEIFRAAGEGLAAAHDAGLVHRDFKPDNVMIGNDGRVRVMDFGLARAFEAGDRTSPASIELKVDASDEYRSSRVDSSITRTGARVGTPAYMAPEQHLAYATDARTDQFSFCVALYEALYGERPFAGRSVEAIVLSVTDGALRSPPRDSPVPRWVHAALERGLAARPEERFADMRQLLQALDRRPRERNRKGAMLGIVGGLAIAGAALALAIPEPDRPCADARALLGGAWDADRAVAVREAFGDEPFATQTAQLVSARLDDYATRWAANHTDACEATHVRHAQSTALLDRRMACLDRQRRELSALVDVFVEADRDVVLRAIPAVGGLDDPDRCADVEALLAAVAPPDDAQTAAAVERVRDLISESFALQQAGRVEAALAAAREAEQAGDQGYPPLGVEIERRLAVALEGSGKYAEAVEGLERAHYGARAIGHDEIAEAAATRLVFVLARYLARYDEAARWARVARAEIMRAGNDPVAEAALASNLAVLESGQSEFDQAEEHFRRALDLRMRALGPDDPDTATALNNLASLLYWRGDYAGSEKIHLRALETRRRIFGEHHPDVSQSLGNLAIARDAQGDHEGAIEYFEQALRIDEAILGPDHPDLAPTLNNYGNALDAAGRREDAIAQFRRSLALREANLGPDHPHVADSLNALGLSLQDDDPAEAVELFRRAKRILEAKEPDGFQFAVTLGNLGGALEDLGDHEEALATYQASLRAKEKLLDPKHPSLAYALAGVGSVLLSLDRPREALAPIRRALEIRTEAGVDPLHVAASQFTLARALAAAHQDLDQARDLAQTALDTYRSGGEAARASTEEVEAWMREQGWL